MNTRRAHMQRFVLPATLLLVFSGIVIAANPKASAQPNLLQRHYREGEPIRYHMTGSNQTGARTVKYEADAEGIVVKDSTGAFSEDLTWSHLVVDGQPVTLPAGEQAFHQRLTLAPETPLALPDLSRVHRSLIGPITDLLNFYADLRLAAGNDSLSRPGDHFVFRHGKPNSWATPAAGVLVGEDAIDFDVTLQGVNDSLRTATVLVKHVPPANPEIRWPADWTRVPVADTPNNWIQVLRTGPESFLAQVGKETFDVLLTVSLADGSLVFATMDNVVEVLQRPCKDATLASPGPPSRYRIKRLIELRRVF